MEADGVLASIATVAACPRPLSWPLPLVGSIGFLYCGVPRVMSMESAAGEGLWAAVAWIVAVRITVASCPEPRSWPTSPKGSVALSLGKKSKEKKLTYLFHTDRVFYFLLETVMYLWQFNFSPSNGVDLFCRQVMV
jgi:hypothetical protein